MSAPPYSGALPRPPPILPAAPGYSAAGVPRPMPTMMATPLPVPAPSPLTLLPPGRAGTQAPVVLLPKSTKLYVGKIAPNVPNEFMLKLLEACGPVAEWKRLEDPETKQFKTFGFCEFEQAESVRRALSLLNDVAVSGEKLVLKCNTQTQQYLDSLEAQRQQRQQLGGAAGPADPEGALSDEGLSAEEKDNQALERIMALLATAPPALPPPPGAAAKAQADSFLAALQQSELEKLAQQKARRRRSMDREEERGLESSGQRERDRQRREAEARALEADAAYKAALRKWEAAEGDRRKALEREREHERDIARERERALQSDLDGEEPEVWRRKLYAGSRRAADRKRRREKEQKEDEADREREAEELAKKARLEEKEREAAAERAAANGHASPATAAAPANPRLDDPNDSITQAMMSAAKASLQQPSPLASPAPALSPAGAAAAPEPAAPPPAAAVKREPAAAARPAPKPRAVLAAFAGEDDEHAPRRTLRPINYTEEERRAAAAPEDKAAAVKALIAAVPTDQDAVFAHAVDWAAFDAGGPALRDKMRSWVSKKTAELLGEEEVSMVDFIIGQLQEHTPAPKLLEELQAVLDDEASPFVFKLFRMVIFETLKQAAGLQE